MSIFGMYLDLGFEHIINLSSYDHILFIITLCGIYILKQWKNVLVLVTAFTIGHSITLVLATLNLIFIPNYIVEILIPVTILITSAFNILHKGTEYSKTLHSIKYATALFFGLIHGLGFASSLQSMMGLEDSLFTPLLAFNLGLEIGQLLIVFSILIIALIFVGLLKVQRREWNLVISGMGAGVAILLIIERIMQM